LLRSIELHANGISVRPRQQPLKLPAGVQAIGVVRVDAGADIPGTPEQIRAVVEAVAELPRQFPVKGVQIDFDATLSQRAFYTEILKGVRNALPPDVPLSITALASWCLDDRWIGKLPIDEAVPMLFQMGPDSSRVAAHLNAGGDFNLEFCRHSAGLSLDEPVWRLPRGRRLFVFSPHGWGSATFEMVKNLRSAL
jgi:hypothetical protein